MPDKNNCNKETGIFGTVLPRDLARKASVVAAMEGKSRSSLMRELLEEYLNNYKIPEELKDIVIPR